MFPAWQWTGRGHGLFAAEFGETNHCAEMPRLNSNRFADAESIAS